MKQWTFKMVNNNKKNTFHICWKFLPCNWRLLANVFLISVVIFLGLYFSSDRYMTFTWVCVDWLRGGRRNPAGSGVQRSCEVMPNQPGSRLVKQGSRDSDGSVSSEGSKWVLHPPKDLLKTKVARYKNDPPTTLILPFNRKQLRCFEQTLTTTALFSPRRHWVLATLHVKNFAAQTCQTKREGLFKSDFFLSDWKMVTT